MAPVGKGGLGKRAAAGAIEQIKVIRPGQQRHHVARAEAVAKPGGLAQFEILPGQREGQQVFRPIGSVTSSLAA